MSGTFGEKIIKLDASAGISGDMFLGAMCDIASQLDASFNLKDLTSKIALEHWELSVCRGERGGLAGLSVRVSEEKHHGHEHEHDNEHHHHRHLPDIEEICAKSDISEKARAKSLEAFRLLAGAEAEVHGTSPEKIHFHEVGAVDSIVDIMGAMLLMDWFGWPQVICSPVNIGSGTVKCAHGILPVPAPATAALLKGAPVFSAGAPMERTTPTGALLLRVLAGETGFRDMPEGRIIRIGTGLGNRDTPELPNVLRAVMLEPVNGVSEGRFVNENLSLLEANIDDMNPQDFSQTMDRLLAAGALDSWCENILMKKGRLAVKFCCLARQADEGKFAEMMMRETTTIGVRIIHVGRLSLERTISRRQTAMGEVRYKSVSLGGEILRSTPEYEDIRAIATEKNMPLPSVRNALIREGE